LRNKLIHACSVNHYQSSYRSMTELWGPWRALSRLVSSNRKPLQEVLLLRHVSFFYQEYLD
jgi:hypothetical protein